MSLIELILCNNIAYLSQDKSLLMRRKITIIQKKKKLELRPSSRLCPSIQHRPSRQRRPCDE